MCCDQPWVQRDYWNNLCDVQFLQNKEGHCQLYSWKSSWSYVQLTGMFHYFSAAKHIISLYICMVANFVMWGYDKFYYIHAVIYSAYLYLNLFVILYSVSLCIPPPNLQTKKNYRTFWSRGNITVWSYPPYFLQVLYCWQPAKQIFPFFCVQSIYGAWKKFYVLLPFARR